MLICFNIEYKHQHVDFTNLIKNIIKNGYLPEIGDIVRADFIQNYSAHAFRELDYTVYTKLSLV